MANTELCTDNFTKKSFVTVLREWAVRLPSRLDCASVPYHSDSHWVKDRTLTTAVRQRWPRMVSRTDCREISSCSGEHVPADSRSARSKVIRVQSDTSVTGLAAAEDSLHFWWANVGCQKLAPGTVMLSAQTWCKQQKYRSEKTWLKH